MTPKERNAIIERCASLAENCNVNPASPVGQMNGVTWCETHNRACAQIAKIIRAQKA